MIRKVRIIWQVFFLVLFFALLYAATQLRMNGWPVAAAAWVDPLIGIAATAAGARADQWLRLACVGGFVLAGLLALWPNVVPLWLVIGGAAAGYLLFP